jgi:hypothetical protein
MLGQGTPKSSVPEAHLRVLETTSHSPCQCAPVPNKAVEGGRGY